VKVEPGPVVTVSTSAVVALRDVASVEQSTRRTRWPLPNRCANPSSLIRTGSPTADAGTRTGATSRWMSSTAPLGATSYTLAKKTMSCPLLWEIRRRADGTPTAYAGSRKAREVNAANCPSCSCGGKVTCGEASGPVWFEVSEYAAGVPPGGLTNVTDPGDAVARGPTSRLLPDSVNVVLLPRIGKVEEAP
jgi:hypothetical protein